ncbi:MAG: hypothetical protein OXT67_11140, partial [Zetaproteobacteria bacterium]|nr:hypothetical protein [Zetaproteobacteria bacterium]
VTKLLPKKSIFPGCAKIQIQVLPPMGLASDESVQEFKQRVRETMLDAHMCLKRQNMDSES